ncbi:MAG TPA: hypothetical protein VGJ91_00215 [Polyangiaceae bacterium]|jgi:hypothetical protein
MLFVAAVLGMLSGCAHGALNPVRVRASDPLPWPAVRQGQGLIVDYKAGERIPVSMQVDGEIIETTPNPSVVWLTVKRDFSVRIRGAEIKTSLDGVHFDDKPAVPGHFQFGYQVTREGGARVVVHVTTPVHKKPEAD